MLLLLLLFQALCQGTASTPAWLLLEALMGVP
jgi:hypothetical protein